jgi:hypothetical protein
MEAPARAPEGRVVEGMTPVDGARIVRVHVTLLDGPFILARQ